MTKLQRALIPLVLIGLFCGLIGCGDVGVGTPQPRTEPVAKVISEKLASTEQQLGIDVWDSNNMVRSRAETVYYLIAEDGTMIEVGLKEYAKVKVGQSITSTKWK